MEQKRYNFNTKPKVLSDSQIKSHMDFDALLSKHQDSTPRRSGGVVRILAWIAPAAAAAVLLLLFLPKALQQNKYPNVEVAYFEEKPFVNPPIPKALATFASQKVDAYKGGVYEYETGSKITVPKAAFINEAGEVIGGEVEIRYREYQDFVDFFLSGIPMHYDSLNQRYQLESAGMVEFYAEQNGKRVNVAPGKSIQVELPGSVLVAPNDPVPDFNVYKLEVDQRNWKYHGPNNMSFTSALSNSSSSIARQKENIAAARKQALEEIAAKYPMPKEPLAPRQANSEDFVFEFDFNEIAANYEGNLQELRETYEGSLWQVAKDNEQFDLDLVAGLEWENFKLEKISKYLFDLTLFSGSKSLKLKVHPVLTGDTFIKEQARHAEAMKTYRSLVAEKQAMIATEQAQVSADFDSRLARLEQTESAKTEQVKKIRRKVISKFVATDFGIWNVDRPLDPHPIQVHGSFVNSEQNKLGERIAYLADSDRNTVSRLVTTNRSPVGFNRSSKTFMWVVTDDKKIAVYRPENFEQIKNEDDSYTFVLKESEKVIETESELRSILSL